METIKEIAVSTETQTRHFATLQALSKEIRSNNTIGDIIRKLRQMGFHKLEITQANGTIDCFTLNEAKEKVTSF